MGSRAAISFRVMDGDTLISSHRLREAAISQAIYHRCGIPTKYPNARVAVYCNGQPVRECPDANCHALRGVVDAAKQAGQARFMTEAVVRIALLENKVTAYYGNSCNIDILKRAKEFGDLVHGAEPKV